MDDVCIVFQRASRDDFSTFFFFDFGSQGGVHGELLGVTFGCLGA